MITLEQIETKHNYTFPKLYKTLFEEDMINWMRGFKLPLLEGKTWADDIYPTLKENPPLLLHSGGSDFELLTPNEMLNFEFPKEWDIDTHHFIPFAKTSEGNTYAFYNNIEIDGQNPIVLIWEDDESEFIAKNFEDFIFRKMIEATDDIDKDNIDADYGKDNENAMELYRADILNDLKTITPYLSENYVNILSNAYKGEVIETLISYGFKRDKTLKEILHEEINFEKMADLFEHEI